MLTKNEKHYYSFGSAWYFIEAAGAYFFVWLLVFSPYEKDINLSQAFFWGYLATVVGIVISGALSHSKTCRQVAILGFSLLILGVLILFPFLALPYNSLLLYLYIIIFGIGSGITKPQLDGVLHEINRHNLSSLTLNTTTLNYFLGLTGNLAALLILSYSSNLYMAIAVIICLIGFFSLLNIKSSKASGSDSSSTSFFSMTVLGFKEMLSNRLILALGLTYFLIGLGSMAVFGAGVALHVKEIIGAKPFYIAASQISWMIGGGIVGAFLFKRLKIKDRSLAFFIGWSIAAIGIMFYGMSTSLYGIIIAGLIWGGGTSIGITNTKIIAQEHTSHSLKGAIFSAFVLISFLGASIGAQLITQISSFFSASLAIVVMSALFWLGILVNSLIIFREITGVGTKNEQKL